MKSGKFRGCLFFLLLVGMTGTKVVAQERCNQAVDYVVEAREQARPGISRTLLERMKVLLDRATDFCSDNGDAWYYRALYARRLNNPRDERFAMDKAERFNSPALRSRDDPFEPLPQVVSSAPASSTPAPASSTPAPGSAIGRGTLRPVREKWALVIGISQFRDTGIRALRYTSKDAKNFAALLKDPNVGRFKPQNVSLLTDEQATERNIRAEIGRLMDRAQSDDLVVCYISTHGSPRNTGQSGVNYIVTHDTDVKNLYSTSLAMISLVDDISRRIRAQRIVLFLDTCYSGAVAGATSLGGDVAMGAKSIEMVAGSEGPNILGRIDATTGRIIISASKDSELSWESDKLQNSIFTYYLMEALKQQNGQATIEQIYQRIKDDVSKRVQQERGPGVSQTPVFHGNTLQGQIDIRIGVVPTSP